MPKEPLFPHTPKKREPLFPHRPKERLSEPAVIGTCYKDAYRFLIEEEGKLVHGSVESQGKRKKHAWVELLTDCVWEPQTKNYIRTETFYANYKPQEEARYTAEEAAIMATLTNHYGPWTEEERSKFLKKKPVQTEPSSSRLEELEAEAAELQRRIRAKYPSYVPEPWPKELERWQGRLWQLGFEIDRERERLGKGLAVLAETEALTLPPQLLPCAIADVCAPPKAAPALEDLTKDICYDFRTVRSVVMRRAWELMDKERVPFRTAMKRAWDDVKRQCWQLSALI